ncbi:MAG: hypothetical protein PHU25_22450 [Deltaproteobacteria bacterium]|nr:hypothetical protein [Deltaproteobacteria bacterium]
MFGISKKREPKLSEILTQMADNPLFWRDLKSRKPEVLIKQLVEYKIAKHPDDRRNILGIRSGGGKVRVVWGEPVVRNSARGSPASVMSPFRPKPRPVPNASPCGRRRA